MKRRSEVENRHSSPTSSVSPHKSHEYVNMTRGSGSGSGSDANSTSSTPFLLNDVHVGGVYCVFVLGEMVVSAGYDKNLYVWQFSRDPTCSSSAPRLILRGHEHIIPKNCLVAYKDRIVSGSWDHTIRVWNSMSGELIHNLTNHNSRIKCLELIDSEFSTPLLISSSEDYTVILWDLHAGYSLQAVRVNVSIVSIAAINCDGGKYVAMLDSAKNIMRFEVVPHQSEDTVDTENSIALITKGHLPRVNECPGTVGCICLFPNETTGTPSLLCGLSDGNILIVDFHGNVQCKFAGHHECVSCMALVPITNQFHVISCDLSGVIICWDLFTLRSQHLKKPQYTSVQSSTYSSKLYSCSVDIISPPKHLNIASVGDDGIVNFYRLCLDFDESLELPSTDSRQDSKNNANICEQENDLPHDKDTTQSVDRHVKSEGVVEILPEEKSDRNTFDYAVEDITNTIPLSPVPFDHREMNETFSESIQDFRFNDDESVGSYMCTIDQHVSDKLEDLGLHVLRYVKKGNSLPRKRREPLYFMGNNSSVDHIIAMQVHLPSLHTIKKPLMQNDRRILKKKGKSGKIVLPALSSQLIPIQRSQYQCLHDVHGADSSRNHYYNRSRTNARSRRGAAR